MDTIKIYIYVIPISLFLFGQSDIKQSSIRNEFNYFMNSSNKDVEDSTNQKNPYLACLLSGIIPGSGQIYSGNYKRGGIFLGIEVASWIYRKHYNKKGDDYVNEYKAFANDHWSFDKWIKDAYLYANQTHPVYNAMINIEEDKFVPPYHNSHHIQYLDKDGISIKTDSSTFEAEYKTACGEASENNDNIQCDTNAFDDVEVVRDHHFYEGISKYDMFFAGWDDTEECNEDIIEENESCSWIFSTNNDIVAMSSNKRFYQYELRHKANENYDYAENALSVIFLNHAFSFFDSFIASFIKNRQGDFNYYTSPIYNQNMYKLEGINFSISW